MKGIDVLAKNKRIPDVMGIVIKWNSEKNFGFVKSFETGESYYINRKSLMDEESVEPRTIVNFEVRFGKSETGEEFSIVRNLCVVEVPERKRHQKKKRRRG